MALLTLGPDEYTTLEYALKRKGPVEFEIDSSIPVKTYILGPRALQRFEEGSKRFKYWGGFQDARSQQKQKVWIPFSGIWYLLIHNPSKVKSADVDYEVYY